MPYSVREGVSSWVEIRLDHSIRCPCGLSAEEAAQCPMTSRSGPGICEDGGSSRDQRTPEEPAPIMLGRQCRLRVERVSFEGSPARKQGCLLGERRTLSTGGVDSELRGSWLCACRLQALLEGLPLSDSACGSRHVVCPQMLGELCLQGYVDALRFLEKNGAYGEGGRHAL